jgi:hypothetical protein
LLDLGKPLENRGREFVEDLSARGENDSVLSDALKQLRTQLRFESRDLLVNAWLGDGVRKGAGRASVPLHPRDPVKSLEPLQLNHAFLWMKEWIITTHRLRRAKDGG